MYLLGLAACVFGPDGDAGLQVERFTALPVYEVWYGEMEECTGIEGNLDRVRFFKVVAPLSEGGGAFPCDEQGTMCPGLWQEPHDIFLAPAVIENEPIVKHEMWHELRQSTSHTRIDSCTGIRLPFGRQVSSRSRRGR